MTHQRREDSTVSSPPSRSSSTEPRTGIDPDALPPRWLPVLYFGSAHVALALAFLVTAIDPRAIGGFFYHHHLIALVHLVTLGWISLSIIGALYLVGPMALRMPMPARQIDYWIFGLLLTGIIGMAGHFWIGEYGGMGWSAGVVAAGFTLMAARLLPRVARARAPRSVKVHILLAFANILAAATMGILLAIDKVHPILSGYVLTNVFAHAHLAAIGWASLMVVGLAYRLLPMVLPAAMPDGRSLYVSAILLEAGTAGLFVALLKESRWTVVFGAIIVAGFAAFLSHVVWMTRHRRPVPVRRPQPDCAVRHVAIAMGYLAVSCVFGLVLAIAPMNDWTLQLASAYGICGLVGFLAQIIVGVQARILPIFAWYHAFARFKGSDLVSCTPDQVRKKQDLTPLPPDQVRKKQDLTPPDALASHPLQRLIFWSWLIGVPCLAGGFAFDAVPLLVAGAWVLFAAAVLGGIDTAWILRHAWISPARVPPRRDSPALPAD